MCNHEKIRRITVVCNIIDKIRLLFRKDKESYLCFYRMLGFYPRNIEIYQQALLHRSSSIKEKGRLLNNERLEFLGDAILDAIVADIVYKHFEGKREGFLTNTRSKIVQRETLNRVAVEIGLNKLIKYATKQSSHNSYMCGNAFEALIGAIYLDRGYRVCKKFMEERIIDRYLNLEKISRKEVNFKSKLIEWSQKNKFEQVPEKVIPRKNRSRRLPVKRYRKLKATRNSSMPFLRQRLNANRRRKQRLKPMECPSRKKPFGKNCWKAKKLQKSMMT